MSLVRSLRYADTKQVLVAGREGYEAGLSAALQSTTMRPVCFVSNQTFWYV